jgi:hypothetical protein
VLLVVLAAYLADASAQTQRRQLPAGAAFTVITGQFLGSATDYPLCAATTPESPRLRTAQLGGYALLAWRLDHAR